MTCDECCATVPERLRREANYCRAAWRAVEGGVVFLDNGSIHNAGLDAATIHRALRWDPKETGCYVRGWD